MNEIDKSLKKKLNELVSIGIYIQKIYNTLYYLEKENKQHTPKFKAYVQSLNKFRNFEEIYLKNIVQKANYDDIATIIGYLRDVYQLFGLDFYYDYVYLTQKIKAVCRTTLTFKTTLCNFFLEIEDEYNSDFGSNSNYITYDQFFIDGIFSSYYLFTNKIFEQNNLKRMNESLEKNINLNFVHENKSMRELYLDHKYNLSFVDREIEKKLIDNYFDVQALKIPTFKEQMEVLGISKENYRDIYGFSLTSNIRKHIEEYTDPNNLDYITPQIVERVTLSLWYLVNILNELNIHQLKEVKVLMDEYFYFAKINEREKRTLLTILDNAINAQNKEKQKKKESKEKSKIKVK